MTVDDICAVLHVIELKYARGRPLPASCGEMDMEIKHRVIDTDRHVAILTELSPKTMHVSRNRVCSRGRALGLRLMPADATQAMPASSGPSGRWTYIHTYNIHSSMQMSKLDCRTR